MKIFRLAVVLSTAVTALAIGSDAKAGVHVRVGNYEPYYVGRVYYAPLAIWRPVYSFPVATPYGVVYQPYVYHNGRVVCRNYIPGPEAGYGEFIVEGRGHYGYHGHHHGRGHSRGHHGKKHRH